LETVPPQEAAMPRPFRALLLVAVATLLGSSTLPAQADRPVAPPPPAAKPPVDRFGRPLPVQTFYCQYAGLAHDASGKYPLYQNEFFSVASFQGAVQKAWGAYIDSTYHPTSPGNPMCAIMPSDPAQREAALKSVNLLTQPASQIVVKVSWKP
jgi:hypothetical protein